MSVKNTKNTAKEKPETNVNSGTGGNKLPEDGNNNNNIDRIRDILFGAKSNEFDKRFLQLEERVCSETLTLKNDVSKRLDSLEKYFKNEIESLINKVKSEKETTKESFHKLSKELESSTKSLDKKIDNIDEHMTQKQKNLNEQLLEQSKSFNEEITRKHNEMTQIFERGLAELKNEKTDKVALAGLFEEFSLRLTDDFKMNGKD